MDVCGCVCTHTCVLWEGWPKERSYQHPERLEELSRTPPEAPRMGSDNACRKPRPDSRGAKVSVALISPPHPLLHHQPRDG